MSRTRSAQRGFAFIVFSVILVTLGLGFVILQSIELARHQANTYQQTQLTRVNAAASRVRAWYLENARWIDAQPADPSHPTLTGANVLEQAQVPGHWNLTAYLSDPITHGSLQYRTISILAPRDSAPAESFDAATGTLTVCPAGTTCVRASATVDGYPIESEYYARSLKQLNDLALAAQAYFNGHFLANPDRDVSVNWFRAPSAAAGTCTHDDQEMACLDGWADIASNSDAQATLALLGLPAAGTATGQMTNAWGGTIYLANGNDAGFGALGLPFPNSAPGTVPGSPYQLALQTLTPWGQAITLYATQTL